MTETLAAMAVIGLATGSLSLGLGVIGEQQWRTGQTVLRLQTARAAETWLGMRLDAGAPFRSHEAERLSGAAQALSFACSATARCEARIETDAKGQMLTLVEQGVVARRYRLADAGAARFSYRGADDPLAAWPPQSGTRQALRSITLVQGTGETASGVFSIRLRAEQPLDCQFDAVMQDCR